MKNLMKKLMVTCLLLCMAGDFVLAQSEALISPEESTLLEKLSGGKRRVDWANMNIQFCSALDASFTDGSLDEAAFKVHRIRLEILGAFHDKFHVILPFLMGIGIDKRGNRINPYPFSVTSHLCQFS